MERRYRRSTADISPTAAMTRRFTAFAAFAGNTEQMVPEKRLIKIEKKGKLQIKSILFSLPFQLHGNLVQIQSVISEIETDCQRQHQRGYGDGNHNTCQHKAAWNRVDIGLHAGDAVHHNGRSPPCDIARFGQKEVDCTVHNI